jgi:TatD DNase family protein
MAEQAMELGFYISFSGIVTFKNAKNVQEIAKAVPLERMLVETDSPYLAPMPNRGKKNEPAYLRFVAEYLADLKGVSYDNLIAATGKNCCDLFKLTIV